MKVENRIRQRSKEVAAALAVAALMCGPAAAHAVSGRVTTIETGRGDKVTLAGEGQIRCVDDGRLTCTIDTPTFADAARSPRLEDRRSALSALNGSGVIDAGVTVTNAGAMPLEFVFTFSKPAAIPSSSLLGGSLAGSVTDSTFTGVGGVATTGVDPLYFGLIDGSPVAGTELHPDPFAVPGPGFPAAFAFRGETRTVAATAFGLPGPSTAGPAVTASIGIQLRFRLAAGNSAGLVALLVAAPGPPAMALGTAGAAYVLGPADLGCVSDASGSTCTSESRGGVRTDLPLERWNLSLRAGAAGCPLFLNGNVVVKNVASTSLSFLFQFVLPASSIGSASVIGGSVGGAVLDGNLDAAGGMGTVTPDALYTALIDGAPVATLHADPLFVPGPAFPGTFSFAGEARNIPAVSFGLPGPSAPGPAVTTDISIQLRFNLAAGDSIELTSMFVADCVPTPTSTPTVTPTPSQTPTPAPVAAGGSCTDPSQCAAGLFCVDEVCCTSACEDPSMRCDVPPNVGTCSDVTAQAPTLSPPGLIVGVLLLLLVAAASLWRRAGAR